MTDKLKSAVRDALVAAGVRHGVAVATEGPYSPDAMHFTLIVGGMAKGCFVSMSRHVVLDEGPIGVTMTFVAPDAPLGRKDLSLIDRFVAEGMRARRRRDAVARHGRGGLVPAWAYVMHRLPRLLLSHAASGRELTFVPVRDNLVKLRRKGSRSKPLATGQAVTIPLADFAGRYGRHVAEARLDRLLVHDLEMGSRPDNSPLAVFTDGERPELLFTGLQLPETALLACAGLDLARIVDHPAFDGGAGIPVISARNDVSKGGVVVRLPLLLEPAGPTPDGVDVSWRTV